MTVHDTCAACHPGAGIYAVNSYTRRMSARPDTRPDLTYRPTGDENEWVRAEEWKQQQYTWGLLRGLTGR
jgi:hypothetical protein